MSNQQTYESKMFQGEKSLEKADYTAAKLTFMAALEIDPNRYDGWLALSNSLYHLKEYPTAIKASEKAEKLDPLQRDFQNIQQAMQTRSYQRAESVAKDMLNKQAGHPRAVFTLAHLFQMQSAFEDQISILKIGLNRSPANIHLRKVLVNALQDAGDIRGAINSATHLLELDSSFANAWSRIGLFIRYGFNEEALTACHAAKPLCGENKALLSELDLLGGHALKTLGKRQEAIAAYRACIANKPESGAPWWALADMKTYKFSKSEIKDMKGLVQRQVLKPEQQCQALFALAKAQEMDTGLPDAMQAYQAANTAYPSSRFNPALFSRASQRLINAASDAALSKQAKQNPTGPRPIFIVGLPRSGSTLLEQILASHSQIEGTMELPVLPNIKRKMHLDSLRRFSRPFLDGLESFSEEKLQQFGQMYLDESAVFRSQDTAFFIDKLPNNFEHVGLIHKILPDAIILDIRRHPMDCGLSLFKQFFARGVEFSYRLEDIGVYYSEYLKIMSHWDKVLPDRVFKIQYEDLVRDFEKQLLKILSFIELEFEPTCLEFHRNTRAVRTASSEQVRQPLFMSSIGVGEQVEHHLLPLKNIKT